MFQRDRQSREQLAQLLNRARGGVEPAPSSDTVQGRPGELPLAFAPHPSEERQVARHGQGAGFAAGPIAPVRAPVVPIGPNIQRRIVDASDKDAISRLRSWADKIASGKGGEIEFPPEIRERAMYFSNGVFLLSRTEPTHSKIAEARAMVRRQGKTIRAEYQVDLSLIANLYRERDMREENVDYRVRDTNASINTGTVVEGAGLEFLTLLDQVARARGSDMQVIKLRETTRVEIIKDDEIDVLGEYPSDWGRQIIHTVAANCQLNGGDRRPDKHQEGSLIKGNGWRLPKGVEGIRLQFNVLANDGEMLNSRLFYSTADINEDVDVVDLGYLGFQGDLIERGYRAPFGAIFMAGPTGSGKSTTIRTILRMINKHSGGRYNIITVENPQEVPIPGAKALRVVGTGSPEEIKRAYVEAMSATLRSAPRVLFFGECRNKEESEGLFTGARTGHLCLTTVHANTALTTVSRMMNEGVSKSDFSDPTLVRTLIGQRLIAGVCPLCRVSFEKHASKAYREARRVEAAFAHDTSLLANIHFRNPKPPEDCPGCGGRGRQGRKIAAEVVQPTIKLLEMAIEHGPAHAQVYWQEELEGFSLIEHGIYHLINGTVGLQDFEDKMGLVEPIPPDRIKAIRHVMGVEEARLEDIRRHNMPA